MSTEEYSERDIKSEQRELLLVGVGVVVFGMLIPFINGFIGNTFEENFNLIKFAVYAIVLLGSAFLISAYKILSFTDSRFTSIIHDADRSSFLGNFLVVRNGYLLMLLFAIVYSIVATASILKFGTGFTGVPQFFIAAQQVTQLGDIVSNFTLAAMAESVAYVAILLTFFIIPIKFLIRVPNKILFPFLMFPLAIIGGFIAIALHGIIYRGDEVSQFAVYGFWSIQTVLMLALASLIPLLVGHSLNNGYLRIFELLGSTALLITSITIILISSLLLFFGYLAVKKLESQ